MGLVTALTPVVTFGAIVFTIFGFLGLGAFTEVGGGVFVETLGAGVGVGFGVGGVGVLKTTCGFGLAIATHPQIL